MLRAVVPSASRARMDVRRIPRPLPEADWSETEVDARVASRGLPDILNESPVLVASLGRSFNAIPLARRGLGCHRTGSDETGVDCTPEPDRTTRTATYTACPADPARLATSSVSHGDHPDANFATAPASRDSCERADMAGPGERRRTPTSVKTSPITNRQNSRLLRVAPVSLLL